MKPYIVLDSGPLGLLMQRLGLPIADSYRQWLSDRLSAGTQFFVPEIADYEVRRELIRLGNAVAIARLDSFNDVVPGRFLGITTAAMRRAAELWAESRRRGIPTADPKELDGDVILAAQVLEAGLPASDVVIATGNPVHLSRFATADLWINL